MASWPPGFVPGQVLGQDHGAGIHTHHDLRHTWLCHVVMPSIARSHCFNHCSNLVHHAIHACKVLVAHVWIGVEGDCCGKVLDKTFMNELLEVCCLICFSMISK